MNYSKIIWITWIWSWLFKHILLYIKLFNKRGRLKYLSFWKDIVNIIFFRQLIFPLLVFRNDIIDSSLEKSRCAPGGTRRTACVLGTSISSFSILRVLVLSPASLLFRSLSHRLAIPTDGTGISSEQTGAFLDGTSQLPSRPETRDFSVSKVYCHRPFPDSTSPRCCDELRTYAALISRFSMFCFKFNSAVPVTNF